MSNLKINTSTYTTPKTYVDDIAHDYFEHLMSLALSRFEWEGLPNGLTSRIIEKQIISTGLVMFFKDDDGVYKCLRASGTGKYNIYNEPTEYMVYGVEFEKTIRVDDGVLIRNNPRNHGDENILMYWANYLNEVQKTKAVNLDVQKTPYIIKTDKHNLLSWKNIMKQIQQYKRAIFTKKETLKGDDLDALQLDAPFLLDVLQDDKNATMQEVLTYLGINNANTDKRERLVVDEVNSNNDFIETNLQLMLEQRKMSVEIINEKYGLNMSVRARDYDNTSDVKEDYEEGDNNDK